ncbi:MAG: hypothetical protein A3G27_04985 [Betaproteobacteria bacterium RIFCSPLOWO2_12_FULL_66_14]|nr:MAG: hypothetical protein A3G27_04985 [Betaproteobacteria bacterium RIFCSPLOWO2_12_FULL_66_14]
MQAANEAQLLAIARRGDGHAFGELVAPHVAKLKHHIHRLVRNEADAEDVLQETLVRAWLGLGRFEGRSSLFTWLYSVAHNSALEFQKTARRRALCGIADIVSQAGQERALETAAHADSPDREVEARERLAALQDCLAAMPAERRTPFLLFACEGAGYREVATRIGIPVGTVRSRIHRARGELGLLRGAAAGLAH